MFGPTAVTTDILDIGTRQADDKRKQAMVSGTGSLCPAKFLGQPAAFDIPNVADVSQSLCYYKNDFRMISLSSYDIRTWQ